MKSTALKVGIFLVAGIVLFCVGLFLIGNSAQLFGSHFVVYADFNNIDTLATGAKVRVGGMDAGQITSIHVPKDPSAKFRLTLQVDDKFHRLVRRDSMASIETEGMVGNIFVNIKKGSAGSPECPAQCTLPTQEPVSMSEMMQKANQIAGSVQTTITDLHHRAETAMQNITDLTGHADKLVTAMSPKVNRMTTNADAIVAGIRQGHGAAGKLLTDPKTAHDVQTMVANATQATTNFKQTSGKVNSMVTQIQQTDLPPIHQTLANADEMSARLNQATKTLLQPGKNKESTALAVRNTIQGAQQTATNMADDTEALKHNLFFRGFFRRRGFFNLETITPEKYAASRFVKKPRVRVWVPAAGLFATGPDHQQHLTDAGKAIVDQSMSSLVRYLPNNPLVVEGYSNSGPPDQQYVAARQRALEVRRYLIGHFHLNAKRVGMMAMDETPPAHTGRKTWDGICLVLVVEKRQTSMF